MFCEAEGSKIWRVPEVKVRESGYFRKALTVAINRAFITFHTCVPGQRQYGF